MGANPGDTVLVQSLGSGRLGQGKIESVHVLAHKGSIQWEVSADGLRVKLPDNLPTKDLFPTISVHGMTDLQWDGIVRQGADDHSIMLRSTQNDLLLGGLFLNVSGNFTTVYNWTSLLSASVCWTVRVQVGGLFNLAIMSASPGGKPRIAKVRTSQGINDFVHLPSTSSYADFKLSEWVPVQLSPGIVQFTMEMREYVSFMGDPSEFGLAYITLVAASSVPVHKSAQE